MEYFVIRAKFVPLKCYYTLIATAASNLVFSWVFGLANSVTRPDRCNAKMVNRVTNDTFSSVAENQII